ncbi:hypothetical protein F4778DRAFT_763588, partial [Xylariomycetidae sp. FL2044]
MDWTRLDGTYLGTLVFADKLDRLRHHHNPAATTHPTLGPPPHRAMAPSHEPSSSHALPSSSSSSQPQSTSWSSLSLHSNGTSTSIFGGPWPEDEASMKKKTSHHLGGQHCPIDLTGDSPSPPPSFGIAFATPTNTPDNHHLKVPAIGSGNGFGAPPSYFAAGGSGAHMLHKYASMMAQSSFADPFDPYPVSKGMGIADDTSGDEAIAQMLQDQWNEEMDDDPPPLIPAIPPVNSYDSDIADSPIQLSKKGGFSSRFHLPGRSSARKHRIEKKNNDALVGDVSPTGTCKPSGASDMEDEAEGVDVEAAESLLPLREFVKGSVNGRCAGCSGEIHLDMDDVFKLARHWLVPQKRAVILGVPCKQAMCGTVTCPGCGKSMPRRSNDDACMQLNGELCSIQWCCDKGRLSAIWVLACGWRIAQPKPAPAPKVISNRQPLLGYPGIPPALAHAKGVGYGGYDTEHAYLVAFHKHRRRPAPIATERRDTKEEDLRTSHYRLLALLLPSFDRTEDLDTSPPDLLPALLKRSPLLEYAATLLGSNSIHEVSSHHSRYDGMLDFVQALGNHTATATLVYGNRDIYHAKNGSLPYVSFSSGVGRKTCPRDTGKSLATLMESLASQARTMLKHAKSHDADFQTTEAKDVLALNERIVTISDLHVTNKQLFRTEMEISKEDDNDFDLSQWHRENCVGEVDDDALLQNFKYQKQARSASGPQMGRMKRLITEISTLQSSLPEGIYVRHGSSRLDTMKVLIIGPRDTPYAHGFFEFDLFCPMGYPKQPPLMHFRTTDGGKIRFNPNLYENGKICLSLLGTWSGEPWRESSTILQVLVSIQSMILCEKPWYNEPGREGMENKLQSTSYNNEVRSWTLQHAILPWINTIGTDVRRNPQTSHFFWQETVHLYLQANAKILMSSHGEAASRYENLQLKEAVRLVTTALGTKGLL